MKSDSLFYTIAVFLLCIYTVDSFASTSSNQMSNVVTAVQNGAWSNASTWNTGAVPDASSCVTIPAGRIVTLDGACVAKNMTINGSLKNNSNINFSINTEWILVKGSTALFQVGTAAVPYMGRAIITLEGINDGDNIENSGDKFISVMHHATMELHGSGKTSWSQLGANVVANSSEITLDTPTNWEIGDKIVIVSSRANWNEAESRTITSIDATGTQLQLDAPLSYTHKGIIKNYTRPTDGKTWSADLRAEVGSLNKNITIQGDIASETNGYGGHIMVHHNAKAYVDGIELYRMGQKTILGRYPFHWHMLGNVGAGQYFKNSSVHISYNRALTIHGTESTLVHNNFFYDHIGHGIFLEDGSERFNTITSNVVLLSKRPIPGEELTPSDNSHNQVQNRTPSSFWITNPNNIFEDNIAAGTHGTGYWFAMPQAPMGASATDPRFQNLKPHQEPLLSFQRNKAHSCMTGFDIFDQLSPSHSLILNRGWDNSDLHLMKDCTWYANDLGVYTGIGAGGPVENLKFDNNIFVENQLGSMLASYSHIQESLFVGNTGENLQTNYRYAYRVYDGAGRVSNCHFVGWDYHRATPLLNNGAGTKFANHLFQGITNDSDDLLPLQLPNYNRLPSTYANVGSPDHPRTWSMVLRDLDGSFSGKVNHTIISNHPFMLTGEEYQHHNWINVFRTPNHYALAVMKYDIPHNTDDIPNVTITRTKPNTCDESIFYVHGYKEHHQIPVIVNHGFMYTYQYEFLPHTKRAHLIMDNATAGDTYMARYKDFSKLGGLTVTGIGHGISVHSSLASLQASTSSGYYIEPNGDLYIKPTATGKRLQIRINWTVNFSPPILDKDGDEMPDSDEILAGRNAFDERDLAAEYSTNNDFEGWTNSNNVNQLSVINDNLSGTAINNGDAYIWNNKYNFEADKIPSIAVRLKATQNTTVEIFFAADGSPGFSAAKRASLSYTGNGTYQDLTFPMSNNVNWTGIVTALRIDPVSGLGVDFDIDWIKASVPSVCASATFSVPETNNYTINAASECTDVDGWTHYYNKSEERILSIKKNGNNIGTIGDGTFQVYVGGTTLAHQIQAPYVTNPEGWAVMGRYWNVKPKNQPTSPVSVRFYYKDSDFIQLKNKINGLSSGSLNTHEELYFYKISNDKDPDPEHGHSLTNTSNFEQYKHTGIATLDSWKYESLGSAHQAEFVVNSFSGGGGGAGSSDFDGAFLPVELHTFTGFPSGADNHLLWITLTEENSDYFELQRSDNPQNGFEKIAEIKAAGFSSSSIDYNYIDNAPLPISYYRLKIIDLDESYEYAPIVVIKRIEHQLDDNLLLFPNPVKEQLRIILKTSEEISQETNYLIFDARGQVVKQGEMSIVNGYGNGFVAFSELPNGTYWIKCLIKDRKDIIRPFVKIHD